MGSDPSPKFFVRLARGLLADRPELGRRYLSLCRRRRVLRAGVREAHLKAMADSPLADVGFRPPLSVAGCASIIIVQAEGLAMEGVPVSLELDSRGRHRGMALGVVLDRLNRKAEASGVRPFTPTQVLEFYRSYMAACPKVLDKHPLPRFAKLPRLMERLRREMDRVQQAMLAEAAAKDRDPTLLTALQANVILQTSRFMAFVDRRSLEEALAEYYTEPNVGVVIGYCPAKGVSVNRRPVKTEWGRGNGIAVVRMEDLWSLTQPPAEGLVGIECLPESWRGWPAGRDQHAPARPFSYFVKEQSP